jgi:hypothetical protein
MMNDLLHIVTGLFYDLLSLGRFLGTVSRGEIMVSFLELQIVLEVSRVPSGELWWKVHSFFCHGR